MNNLKIGTRLWAGFSLIVLLILCVALFSYLELRNIKTQTDNLAKINFVKAQLSADVNKAMQSTYTSIITIAYSADPAIQQHEKDKVEKQRGLYREAFKKLEGLETSLEGKFHHRKNQIAHSNSLGCQQSACLGG